MVQGHFDFGFPVVWMRKDRRICTEEATRTGALLPTTALIGQYCHEVINPEHQSLFEGVQRSRMRP